MLSRLILLASRGIGIFVFMCVGASNAIPRDAISRGYMDLKQFPTELNQSTKAWAEDLREKSKQIQMNAIKPREFSGKGGDANLYVFVTTKMKDKNLKSLIKEAKKYNAVLLLRGLKDESMIKTIEYFQSFLKEDLEGLAIDPTLFKEYGIERVPTFVLEGSASGDPTSEVNKRFDKIEGNISIRYALEKMADQGDLREEAAALLGGGA